MTTLTTDEPIGTLEAIAEILRRNQSAVVGSYVILNLDEIPVHFEAAENRLGEIMKPARLAPYVGSINQTDR